MAINIKDTFRNIKRMQRRLEIIAEALGKQIEAVPLCENFSGYNPESSLAYYCPTCNSELEEEPLFCPFCGQALLWF